MPRLTIRPRAWREINAMASKILHVIHGARDTQQFANTSRNRLLTRTARIWATTDQGGGIYETTD